MDAQYRKNLKAVMQKSKEYTDNIYTLATNNIAGKDTSTNILAFTENKGIYIGSDDGNWYFWDGTHYVAGGVYLSTGNVITHIDNQLLDENNNILYPIISEKFERRNYYNPELTHDGYFMYNNVKTANANYCYSDLIDISNFTYVNVCSYTSDQTFIQYYDSARVYISSQNVGSASGVLLTIPNNTKYITISIKISLKNQFILSDVYRALDYVNFEAISARYITDTKLVKGGNLYNKDRVFTGAFSNITNGDRVTNANYFTSDFIDIENLSKVNVTGFIGQNFLVFFDNSHTYISGVNVGNNSVVNIPNNAKYVVISANKQYVDTYVLTDGKYNKGYLDYQNFKGDNQIIVEVDANGNGDYTSLVDAITFINSKTSFNPKAFDITIYLKEGTYNVFDELGGSSSLLTPDGVIIPENTKLIGVGNRDNIIINGYCDSTYTDTQKKRISPLYLIHSCYIENITVIGENCRYAIHQDNADEGAIITLKNVKARYLGNDVIGLDGNCYGSGVTSGNKIRLENCDLYCENTTAYSCHSKATLASNSNYIELINCHFTSNSVTPSNVNFRTIAGQVKNYVSIIGCKFVNENLRCEVTSGYSGFDFIIWGYGNSNFNYIDATGESYTPDFSDR